MNTDEEYLYKLLRSVSNAETEKKERVSLEDINNVRRWRAKLGLILYETLIQVVFISTFSSNCIHAFRNTSFFHPSLCIRNVVYGLC